MKYLPKIKEYVKLTFVIVTLLFLLFGCAPTSYLTINQLHFQTIARIPVVEGAINGKRAYFIIDTGASVSILNEAEAKHFGFKFRPGTNQSISGFNGRTKINQAFNCIVEVGPVKVSYITFHTKCLKEVADIIWQNEQIEIAGIIGSDIFALYNITINFKNKTISFS